MKKRILLVDGEEANSQALAQVLREQQYQVVTATDGLKAWALLKEHTFDLVVTDLHMPRLSGTELLRMVKTSFPQTGIIVLSAQADIESYLNTRYLGAFEYVRKPVRPGELARIVASYFQNWVAPLLYEEVRPGRDAYI